MEQANFEKNLGSPKSSHEIPQLVNMPSAIEFPFGFLAYLGAGASVAACFAKFILGFIFVLFGFEAISVNPHIQAVFMWVFGLVAIVGLARDKKYHNSIAPLAIGVCGFLIIVGTLYTYYDDLILLSGYIFLVIAAFLNQNVMLNNQNETIQYQANQLASLNSTLEERVQIQVSEIERLDRLKRFLPPNIANVIMSTDKESLLESHRRYVATLFCDIRDFTTLSENIEPEEVISVLQNYHEQLGLLVAQHEGTIGYRAGDGLMVFFNDPFPCDEPVLKAVSLGIAMQKTFNLLKNDWERLGYNLGFGVGVASGYATLGVVGFEGCYDYTAIGNVVNISARLCDAAKDGEILLNHRAFLDIEQKVKVESMGSLNLKGIATPVEAHKIIRLNDST
ncbi:MAG: adenylate/guanylate cyclase domain-containing protein [Desulfobulbia bacterium]